MGKKDARVDAYIAKAPPYAKPILKHLRKVVHAACPGVQETMKWSTPHFDYNGIMCGMSAFKEHCVFGFWKGELILGGEATADPMRQFGRIHAIDDLPSERVLAGYVKKAMALNEAGVKAPHMVNRRARPTLATPRYLKSALKKNPKALATFESFSPSHRREYIEWITEAKTDATREKRLATAIEWMAEGKPRHWKYMRSS
jgi:uncharacterized protein YdeI (YjbR/CyaY-like superfamily)